MIAFVRPMAHANRYIQNVPLNYVHLAAFVRERGYEPLILDMVFDEMTPERVDREIREHGIRLVGIGCMTCELTQAFEQAARLKAVHPGLQIVFGGAHPSGDPEECLRAGVADYVIVGEGEMPLAGLLDAIREGRVVREEARVAAVDPLVSVEIDAPVEVRDHEAHALVDRQHWDADMHLDRHDCSLLEARLHHSGDHIRPPTVGAALSVAVGCCSCMRSE